MSTKRVIGIIDEDPFDPRTWSGSSACFFQALKDRGVLHDTISAKPHWGKKLVYQGLSFHPMIDKWRFKYHLNTGCFREMTQAAKHVLKRVNAADYEVIVKVKAWYDMTGYRDKRVVSYHDGNLATLLASPHGYPAICKAYIHRTLAYERALYNRIDLIFPMSKWLADSFVRDFGIDVEKVFPIGAGINLPRVRNIQDKSYDSPQILFVGKDFKRKGGEYYWMHFNLCGRR